MDKITYLRKVKERINEEYLEKLHGIDEIFKSENAQIAIYVGKSIFDNLYHTIDDNCRESDALNGMVYFDKYELKSLLRGKLIHPSVKFYGNTTNSCEQRFVSDWFVSRCPKCGCYLYYPCASTSKGYPEYDKHGFGGICANCFKERLIENTKAINFSTEKSGQLVNYKYYLKAGTMNRDELEQFMMELGVEMYGSEILRGISKDLKRLELGDVIDSDNANNCEHRKDTDESFFNLNKHFGGINEDK